MKNLEKTLRSFYRVVVRQARKNLKRLGKDASGTLSRSLKSKVKVSKSGRSFEADLLMEEYGIYVDAGVKGVGGRKADGSNWKRKKVTTNKFRYKSLKPPAKVFDKWSIRKGIAGRDSKGRFVKRKSVNFAIANSVYHTGLETTNFLTNPFNKQFKQLPDDVIEAFGLDAEDLIKFSLKIK